jgi:alkyl sulfatase BDS1-like metallo-beta-lactamase superfamily hydrolase
VGRPQRFQLHSADILICGAASVIRKINIKKKGAFMKIKYHAVYSLSLAIALSVLATGGVIAKDYAKKSGDDATVFTTKLNDLLLSQLAFCNNEDFEFAQRGFIGTREDPLIKNTKGAVVWDLNSYSFLGKQRDMYKYMHDLTVCLMNHGFTDIEIAENFSLPDSLGREWYNRGYYGTLSHNTKAIYQRYLGWYDGNPANLNALPRVEAGKKYLSLGGGEKIVLRKARESYRKGEY